MKQIPAFEKLQHTTEFQTFTKDNPKAFLVAGFFVLDYETQKHLHQLDYYVPGTKKVAAFTLGDQVTMQLLSLMKAEVPEQLDPHTAIDLAMLPGIVAEEMHNRTITESVKKIIAVLQTVKGKKLWTLNCVLSGMGILKARIDDTTKTVLAMEKSSIMDYLKKMPGSALQHALKQADTKTGKNLPPEEKHKLEGELKRLDELEQKIELEKAEIKRTIGHIPDDIPQK